MLQRQVTLSGTSGLHARPAAAFINTARRFSSRVRVRLGDREAEATSLFGVLSLRAMAGDTLVLTAAGPDEREALETLVSLLEREDPER